MSAMGIGPDFAVRTRLIGAHADYRRTDFMFARSQSNVMRDVPWEHRLKPPRPWGEITGYAAAICAATILASAFL